MVRTKAGSSARKAVAAKAPRKQVGGSSGGSDSSSAGCLGSPNSGQNKYAGGNAVKWWPAPSWQKGISQFFSTNDSGAPLAEEQSSEHPDKQAITSTNED